MTAKFRSKNIAEWVAIGTAVGAVGIVALGGAALHAQGAVQQGAPVAAAALAPTTTPAAPAAVVPPAVTPPPDYVIGAEDLLSIVYWRDKDMSAEVTVRPDGKISLPLLNDLQAAGLTPDQLRDRLVAESKRFIEDPNVTVVVRQINSRKVFITGEVNKPGPYPLSGPTTVLQLIAVAGGLRDYADEKNIVIVRTENGRQASYRFNYKDVASRKNLGQNIALKPGDTVIVP
jgi:polysaccharide biosynthesis/export protein